jgi:hypothetical protein
MTSAPKRADIDNDHVIDLARRWQHEPLVAPGVIWALVSEGVPPKVAYAKVMYLVERGVLEYGTSPHFAWPVNRG